MAIEPIKGFYVHDEVTDTDGVAKYDAGALENLDRSLTERYRAPDSKAVGDRFSAVEAVAEEANEIAKRLNEGGLELKDEVLEENISAWLNEHPEATTTVEDGALAQSKLSNSLDARKPSFYSTVSEMQEDEQYRLGATAISDGAVYTVRSAVEVNDPEDMVDPSVLYKYDGQYYHGGLTENDRQIAMGYECVNGFALFVAEYKNAYVTPQMYGAVGDGVKDDSDAIQNAVDSGKIVVIPTGKYFISKEIVIDRNGVTILGCGMGENETMIETNGTNAFHIKSGHRLISIKDICLNNTAENCAGIEISGTGDSTHFIEIENAMINRFKYGILAGGVSTGTSGDGKTYLWNCSFKNIKINSFDHTADRTGIKIMYNGGSNFGLVFERVYVNGYKYILNLAGCESVFTSCNFGLNSVDAVRLLTISKTVFVGCNFECDHKVTGDQYQAVISAGYRTTFNSCSFITELASTVSMLYWGSDYYVVFSQCTWKAKSGDEMTDFYSKSIASPKYSVAFVGGNESMPRPSPYASRSLQVLDLERSTLPIRKQDPASETPQIGEMQYNNIDRVGAHPIWYTGTEWLGAPGGQWGYLDGIESGGTTAVTLTTYDDRPRTAIVTVRGNSSEVYYTGILYFYRGAQASTLVQLAAAKCTVTNANNGVLTITNDATNTQYMYWSIVNLI